MIKKSLALRVLALTFLLIALPLLLESLILFTKSFEKSIDASKERLITVILEKAPEVERLAESKRQLLRELEDLLKFEDHLIDLPSLEMNKSLKNLAETGHFSEMAFLKLDEEGRYICKASSIPENIGLDYSTGVNYKSLAEFGSYVYPTFEDYNLNKFFYIGIQVYNKEHAPIGIFMLSININAMLKDFLKPTSGPDPINFALLTQDYIVFAASNPELELQLLRPLSPIRRAQIIEMQQFEKLPIPSEPLEIHGQKSNSFFKFNFNGEKQLAYTQPIPVAKLVLMSYIEQRNLFGPEFISLLKIYTAYAFILLLGAAITYALTLRMAKPLKNLSKVMSRVQEGDYDARYVSDPLGFEINSLGQMFNQMIYSLLNQMKKAEEARVDKEVYLKELKIGREVQQSLLPQSMPTIEGIELSGKYIPANEVGGDFYDVYMKTEKNGQDSIILTIADAAGKGISACLYSLGVRSMLRTFTKDHDDISSICNFANDLFIKDAGDSGMFVTVLIARYNILTRELKYFSCGHVPGLVRRKDGTVVSLNHSGMALGLLPYRNVSEDLVHLFPGDIVIFYSDSIIEAYNEKNQIFSETRLIELLQQRKWTTAEEISNGILDELREFIKNTTLYDDITLLVMRIYE